MEKSLFNLGSNMLYLQKRIDTISNNVSNSSTKGFKKDLSVGKSFNGILAGKLTENFPESMKNWNSGTVGFIPGKYIDEVITDLKQGLIEETGDNSDIALFGSGFFSAETENGNIYLRTASLDIDNEGYLSIDGVGRVNGNDGPIQIGNNDFNISDDGTITVGSQIIDKLEIIDFEDKSALIKMENGLFLNLEENNIIVSEADVVQGGLEVSNVDITEEMTNVIEVSRNYETTQRAIQMLDQIYNLASNEIGKA